MPKVREKPNLRDLGRKLLKDGPVKTLPTPRRVRILFDGSYVADTTDALFVWEHEYYPYYYVPRTAFAKHALQPSSPEQPGLWFWEAELHGATRSTDRILVFGSARAIGGGKSEAECLADMVRVEFDVVDAWFEEDTRIHVHPKDPYRRVDTLLSSRPLKVRVLGQLVAETTAAVHLYETGLPCRYYVPPTAVPPHVLQESGETTACPYKGVANYYDVVVEGKKAPGLIWYYRNPTLECAAIAGYLCFYHEKDEVEIEIDGEVVPSPKTPWS